MIVFKKFGKTIKIRNDDWKRLRARYNSDNAVLNTEHEVYEIKKECSFCSSCIRSAECGGCPLAVFGKFGCYEFFERVFPSGIEFESDVIDRISWDECDDKKARGQLTRLQKMMDKIEASQGRKDATK